MKYEIKNRWDGSIIYQDEAASLKALLEAAVTSRAHLSRADLSEADLSRANLSRANLSRAHLSGADLSGADLSGADLFRANLSGADLSGANLSGANLSRANLSRANLKETKNGDAAIAQASILPSDGPLFGWKKCRAGVLVKLFIPSRARRSHAAGRKCRAERAKVLEVIGGENGISIYDASITYKLGEWVHCDNWNEDRWTECGSGIHFFITRTEAEAYQ